MRDGFAYKEGHVYDINVKVSPFRPYCRLLINESGIELVHTFMIDTSDGAVSVTYGTSVTLTRKV